MKQVSFVTANLFARELAYRLDGGGWPAATAAAERAFRPLETFPARFGALLAQVRGLGFDAIDLWTGQLDWRWATPGHVVAARRELERHRIAVRSLAGSFGASSEELEAACRLAAGLGTRLLGGRCRLLSADRAEVVRLLIRHDLVLAVENHDEAGPEAMRGLVGSGDGGRIATAIDTGWYGTYGHDVVAAVDLLGPAIAHVHLKDIEQPGAHVTTELGAGCLPLRDVVRALARSGYAGPLAIEHEPEDRDPGPECARSLALLRQWLEEA